MIYLVVYMALVLTAILWLNILDRMAHAEIEDTTRTMHKEVKRIQALREIKEMADGAVQ